MQLNGRRESSNVEDDYLQKQAYGYTVPDAFNIDYNEL